MQNTIAPSLSDLAAMARDTLQEMGFTLEHQPMDDEPDNLEMGYYQATISKPEAHVLVNVETSKRLPTWRVYVDDGEGTLEVEHAREFARDLETASNICTRLNGEAIAATTGRTAYVVTLDNLLDYTQDVWICTCTTDEKVETYTSAVDDRKLRIGKKWHNDRSFRPLDGLMTFEVIDKARLFDRIPDPTDSYRATGIFISID
jgi:hypothetical protein